jgi:hypothetical protein
MVHKQTPTAWVIEDTVVDITANTTFSGDIPLNSLVRVTMRRTMSGPEALEISAIAPDAGSVPYALDGTVEEVTDNTWVVDSERVYVPPERGVRADKGDLVEISAVPVPEGPLVAQQVQLVDSSQVALLSGYVTGVTGLGEENQTWTLQVFQGTQTEQRLLHINPETYVDEDRAVIKPDVEAQVEGRRQDASNVDAALVRLEQPVPVTVAGQLTSGGMNELSQVGAERVWFESTDLMQAARTAAMAVSGEGANAARAPGAELALADVIVRGVRLSNGVVIAKEVFSPAAARAAGISAELAQPASASSLSAADWYGPTGVSTLLTDASRPTVLFDAKGVAHAVFESWGKIYYTYQPPGGLWQPPCKIGTGGEPVATFDSKGELHVAFSNLFLNNYDILAVRLTATGWTLPHVVAPTSGQSHDPMIAADANGKVYVAWMDSISDEYSVQIGVWDGGYWTSSPMPNGRGQSPAVTVMPDGAVFVSWQDRIPLGSNLYGNYDIFASERKDTSWSLPVNVSDNRTFRPGSDSIGVRTVGISEGPAMILAHLAWIDDGVQVRYDYGRDSYWPAPVDVGASSVVASGLSMQFAADGLLYIAWDESSRPRITANPPRADTWPAPSSLAMRDAPADVRVSDVSLSAGNGGVAVAWIQSAIDGTLAIYESRHGMALPKLRGYLPLVISP